MFLRKIVDDGGEVENECAFRRAAAGNTVCLAQDNVVFELRGKETTVVWIVCEGECLVFSAGAFEEKIGSDWGAFRGVQEECEVKEGDFGAGVFRVEWRKGGINRGAETAKKGVVD